MNQNDFLLWHPPSSSKAVELAELQLASSSVVFPVLVLALSSSACDSNDAGGDWFHSFASLLLDDWWSNTFDFRRRHDGDHRLTKEKNGENSISLDHIDRFRVVKRNLVSRTERDGTRNVYGIMASLWYRSAKRNNNLRMIKDEM
jgi:hypothetical protein